jgi:hypothetical protein
MGPMSPWKGVVVAMTLAVISIRLEGMSGDRGVVPSAGRLSRLGGLVTARSPRCHCIGVTLLLSAAGAAVCCPAFATAEATDCGRTYPGRGGLPRVHGMLLV